MSTDPTIREVIREELKRLKWEALTPEVIATLCAAFVLVVLIASVTFYNVTVVTPFPEQCWKACGKDGVKYVETPAQKCECIVKGVAP